MFKFRKKLGLLLILSFFFIEFISSQTEICYNGIDDDKDGLVDCFDPDCFESPFCDDFYYGPDNPCNERPPIIDDFKMTLKWQTNDAYFIDQRCNAFVGDMDGDGIPDVVSKTGFNDGFIRIFDGQTGEIKQSISSLISHPFSEPAIGDVDGNGKGDIFIVGEGGSLGRYEYGNPNSIWVVFDPDATYGIWTTPQLADFNGDGYPEVYVGNRIFSAITGVRYTIDPLLNTGSQNIVDRYSLAYDIFKPGDPKPSGGRFGNEAQGLELIVGNQVLTVELGNGSQDGGRLKIASEITGSNLNDGFVSIADVNKDHQPDILVSSNNVIYLWNPYTQSLIARPYNTIGNSKTGRACIGNFDNDPQIELGVVSRDNLTVFDINTSNKTFIPKWNKSVDDKSSLTTCTLFDFNGDSKNEVVYSDQEFLYILDGTTGAELSKVQCRAGTRTEYPVIADVDADGHAEIIMTCQNVNGPANSRQSFVRVYQSQNDTWMPTRKVWNQHGYFITNVNDNLTIPAQQQSHVAAPLNDIFNGFLMQLSPKDVNGDPIQPVPDVIPVHIETDNSNCPESILVMIQIENVGETSFPSGMPISIYKGDPFSDSAAKLLSTEHLSIPIVNGTTQNFTFQIDSMVELPADIYVVLNDNGSLAIPFSIDDFPNTQILECDYVNVIHLVMSCTEICGNGIDDDNNGLTDCEDPACQVEGSELDIILCKPETYLFNDIIISETGTYYDTIPSAMAMCDSVITLNVIVNEAVFESINQSICENDAYSFGNQMLSESGIYYDTTIATNGCDSITELNLSIIPIPFTKITAEICEGDDYPFGGKMYHTLGQYFDTIQVANHCDSIVQLDLDVHQTYEIQIEKSICQGSSFKFGNQSLNETGIYTEHYQTILHCDSTVTLNLTVMDELRSTSIKTICEGETYPFGDKMISETGTYTRHFKTEDSCDVLETLILTVSDNTTTEVHQSICSGDSYAFNGQNLNQTGQYEQILSTQKGCDSTIILHLEVLPPITENITEQICKGEQFSFGNKDYASSGIYEAVFQSSNGCDSTVQLTLEVQDVYEVNIEKNLCDGDTFIVDQIAYTDAGNYDINLQSQSGCDSIIHLSIQTGNSSLSSTTEDICEGETFDFYGQVLSESGNYEKSWTTKIGCDSTIRLHLNVHANQTKEIDTVLCYGESFNFGNTSYSKSGIYEKHFSTAFGCDSQVVLNLQVIEQLEHFIEKSICDDEAFETDGHVYSKAGKYEYLLTSQNGCDSTIHVDLQIHDNYDIDIKKEICEGENVEIDHEKFTQTGLFDIALSTIYGCDSIIHLDLTVFPTYHTPIEEAICQNDTFMYLNKAYTKAGIYEIPLQTIDGCDSLIELNLEVYPNPNFEILGVKNFCVGEKLTLRATKGFEKYLWNTGDTNPTLITDQAGTYELQVTDQNNCKRTKSVLVNPPIQLEPHFSSHPPYCLGVDDGLITIDSVTGGMPPYIISFDGENFENQEEFTDLPPGDYPIIISDGNDCITEFMVTLTAPYELDLDLETNVELKYGDSMQLFAIPNFDAKYVIWTPETGLSCSNCSDPYVNIRENIIYTVTAYDQNGCLAENQLSLRIINNHDVYIPSGFTPNGDGINDVFTVYTDANIQEVEILEVFDRWGNKVFTQSHFPANQIEFGWDGTFANENMNPGVFSYYTFVLFLDGKRKWFKGDVTLLR